MQIMAIQSTHEEENIFTALFFVVLRVMVIVESAIISVFQPFQVQYNSLLPFTTVQAEFKSYLVSLFIIYLFFTFKPKGIKVHAILIPPSCFSLNNSPEESTRQTLYAFAYMHIFKPPHHHQLIPRLICSHIYTQTCTYTLPDTHSLTYACMYACKQSETDPSTVY